MTMIDTYGYRIDIRLDADDLTHFRKSGYLALPDPLEDGKAILLKGGRHYEPSPGSDAGGPISAVCTVLGGGLSAFERGECRTWEKAHMDNEYFIRITGQ